MKNWQLKNINIWKVATQSNKIPLIDSLKVTISIQPIFQLLESKTLSMTIFTGLLGLAVLDFLFFEHSGLQYLFLLHVLHIKLVGQNFGFNLLLFLFFFPKLLLLEFFPSEVDLTYKANYSNFYFFSDFSISCFLSVQLWTDNNLAVTVLRVSPLSLSRRFCFTIFQIFEQCYNHFLIVIIWFYCIL